MYRIEKGGRFLIEQLKDMNISMDKYKTSQLGQALKRVYRSEITIDDSVKIAKEEIASVFNNDKNLGTGFYGDEIGICPLCGGKVIRDRHNYACKNSIDKCTFKMNFKILGESITKEQASKILQTGSSDSLNFQSKSGKQFSSKLKLENGKLVFDFESKNQPIS